jgi:hypothetical protein
MNDAAMLRHNGLGIASFSVALVVLLSFFVIIAIAGFLHASGSATPAINSVIGIEIFYFAAVDVVAFGLGIAALFDRTAKKVFPILGLTVGVGGLLIVGALIVIGLKT